MTGQRGPRATYHKLRVRSQENLGSLIERGQAGGHLRDDLEPDFAADLLHAVLHDGVDEAVQRRLGGDLFERCASPELDVERSFHPPDIS